MRQTALTPPGFFISVWEIWGMLTVEIWNIVGNTRRDCGCDMATSYPSPREWSRAKATKKAS